MRSAERKQLHGPEVTWCGNCDRLSLSLRSHLAALGLDEINGVLLLVLGRQGQGGLALHGLCVHVEAALKDLSDSQGP
eukprot:UN2061